MFVCYECSAIQATPVSKVSFQSQVYTACSSQRDVWSQMFSWVLARQETVWTELCRSCRTAALMSCGWKASEFDQHNTSLLQYKVHPTIAWLCFTQQSCCRVQYMFYSVLKKHLQSSFSQYYLYAFCFLSIYVFYSVFMWLILPPTHKTHSWVQILRCICWGIVGGCYTEMRETTFDLKNI